MKRNKLLEKMYIDKLIDGEEITDEEYNKLNESGFKNIFEVYATENGVGKQRPFKTSGITEDTKVEIQYRTYKCARTIRNIMIAALVVIIIGVVISAFTAISNAHKAEEISSQTSSYYRD